jgi:hypothetical protein
VTAAPLQCEECGYDLSASPSGDTGVTCPECGARFAAAPYSVRPWPAWWRIVLALCGPHMGFLILAWIVVRVGRPWPILWIGWPLALACIVMFGVVIPVWSASEFARAHSLRPARGRVTAQLASAGVMANAVVTAPVLWLLITG